MSLRLQVNLVLASVIAVILVLLGLGLALFLQRLGGTDKSASQLDGA